MTFSLLNIRNDYVFKCGGGCDACTDGRRYFQQDDEYVLAATSNTVAFANANEPTHGHIALTGRTDEMRCGMDGWMDVGCEM